MCWFRLVWFCRKCRSNFFPPRCMPDQRHHNTIFLFSICSQDQGLQIHIKHNLDNWCTMKLSATRNKCMFWVLSPGKFYLHLTSEAEVGEIVQKLIAENDFPLFISFWMKDKITTIRAALVRICAPLLPRTIGIHQGIYCSGCKW